MPTIPPHRRIDLPGVHAYAQKSIAAGDQIRFRVSSTIPHRLSVCRLGPKVDDRKSDTVLYQFDESPPVPQPIHPGSYVHVENGIPREWEIRLLTMECWIRPWRLDAFQALLTQYDSPNHCGLGLFITSEGQIAFYLGDGAAFNQNYLHTGPKLRIRQWHHVVAVWDGFKKQLWFDGELAGDWEHSTLAKPGSAQLRLGACGEEGLADHFLDGDLASPIIYNRALGAEEIARRYQEKGLQPPTPKGILAHWPLDEETSDTIHDRGPHQRHGKLINQATWMIGGPSFDGTAVPRYKAYEPASDPLRGHGLRFARDDLSDCQWRVTHEYRIPKDAQSGIYVGRVDFEWEGKPHQYYITFVVRRPVSRPKAPILVLCSTNTWLAYGGTAFAANGPSSQFWGTGGLANSDPEAPAYCFYRDHHAEQPAYHMGLNMPWPVAGPDVLYSPPRVGYSHLMRGERFAHVWLDEEGYEYDVIADHDLHRNPELLHGYQTVLINGHSEYWSAEAYEGLDRYLRNGGTTIVLSGNSLFWRVSFNEDLSVIECRKYDDRIGGKKYATLGELYHSHDQKRGSLMRECGFPAWRIIGLECDGWGGTSEDAIGVYRTVDEDHFLFTTPEKVGVVDAQTFGHAPDGGLPKAIGHEWDVRLSTLKRMTHAVPEGTLLPEEPAGIELLAQGIRQGGGTLDYFTQSTDAIDGVCAEMIYWKRPQGGRVFHAGAIAAGWTLSADPKLQRLIRNVLHHFDVQPTKSGRA